MSKKTIKLLMIQFKNNEKLKEIAEQKLEKLELSQKKIESIARKNGWVIEGMSTKYPINHHLSKDEFNLWAKIISKISKKESIILNIRIYNHKLSQSIDIINELTTQNADKLPLEGEK